MAPPTFNLAIANFTASTLVVSAVKPKNAAGADAFAKPTPFDLLNNTTIKPNQKIDNAIITQEYSDSNWPFILEFKRVTESEPDDSVQLFLKTIQKIPEFVKMLEPNTILYGKNDQMSTLHRGCYASDSEIFDPEAECLDHAKRTDVEYFAIANNLYHRITLETKLQKVEITVEDLDEEKAKEIDALQATSLEQFLNKKNIDFVLPILKFLFKKSHNKDVVNNVRKKMLKYFESELFPELKEKDKILANIFGGSSDEYIKKFKKIETALNKILEFQPENSKKLHEDLEKIKIAAEVLKRHDELLKEVKSVNDMIAKNADKKTTLDLVQKIQATTKRFEEKLNLATKAGLDVKTALKLSQETGKIMEKIVPEIRKDLLIDNVMKLSFRGKVEEEYSQGRGFVEIEFKIPT